jgi:glucose/arabinose dehydrogenase
VRYGAGVENKEANIMGKSREIRFVLSVCLLGLVLAGAGKSGRVLAQSAVLYLPLLSGGGGQVTPVSLALEPVVAAGELQRPVDIAHAGDERLFVVERAGTIRIVEGDGSVQSQPFLDITDRVEWQSHGERGLLGLVFHPDYENNGLFYVNYTAKPDGATRISRFEVTTDPHHVDENSEVVILTVPQPAANHNAGDLAFSPDGYLYIPLGDGGGGNDPGNRAQDPGQLLGKVLRLDVDNRPGSLPPDCDSGGAYHVPAGNPLVGEAGACDEIWALGLRNPWRFSFDYQTNEIFIADVGQGAWEEVNARPATSAGENYGWSCYEGSHPNPLTFMPACEPASAYTLPVFEYANDAQTCAVTGGFVYRGQQYPALVGRYLFTDYCSGSFWDMAKVGGEWLVTRHDNLNTFGFGTFGEGVDGELYVANHASGALYHIVETGSSAP